MLSPISAAAAMTATTGTERGPQVDAIRQELLDRREEYQLIRDVIAGAPAVRRAGARYLPALPEVPGDLVSAKERNADYARRAVFYNVTQRTLGGLIGTVFTRPPVVDVPPLLEVILKDADGSGRTIVQLAKGVVRGQLAYGRGGLLADYPNREGTEGVSLADLQSGRVRPIIRAYDVEDVINWRTVNRGGNVYLSLVVLQEMYDVEDDGFASKQDMQWRVLRLDANYLYTVTLYRKGDNGFYAAGYYEPRDGSGQRLTEIPFTFVGAEDNSPEVDEPPLYPLADVNIGHYRNSAEFEQSVAMLGQPTTVISGLTEEWAKNVLGGKVVLGSRQAIMLPDGGSATLLEVTPNTLAVTAMEAKERQMVALGAKIVEQRKVQRTAAEAGQEYATENSILQNVADNASAAIKWCLEWCAIFANLTTIEADARSKAVDFKLSTDFELSGMTPEEQKAVVASWQGGLLTFEEARDRFRRAGLATLDDAKARQDIDADAAKAMANAIAEAQSLGGTGDGGGNTDDPPAGDE